MLLSYFLLLFTGRSLLALLAVRVDFVDHIDAPFAPYDLVSLRGICLYGCFYLHAIISIRI